MKITVCMSTFNGENYLDEQLDSIVHQTKIPDEIIIVDDCSTDHTLTLLHDYANKYNNIVWKIESNIKNIGWRINFHKVINKATGDYIFLSDQDDIWNLDKIEKMSRILDSNEHIDVLTTNLLVYNSETNELKKLGKNDESLTKLTKCSYLSVTARPGCTMAFKKRIIKEFNNVWQANFPHDAILWRIAYLKGTLYNFNYYGIKWRRHSNAATVKKVKKLSSKNVMEHYKVILLYCEYLKVLENIENIKDENSNKIRNFKMMVILRKKMYENPSLLTFFKLNKYIKYYPSFFSYLLDILPLIKNVIK